VRHLIEKLQEDMPIVDFSPRDERGEKTRTDRNYGARRRDPMIRIVIILMIAKALYNHPPTDDRDF
jgi:hypothetical protein